MIAVLLAWQAARVLRSRAGAPAFAAAFRGINLHALLVMALVAADAL